TELAAIANEEVLLAIRYFGGEREELLRTNAGLAHQHHGFSTSPAEYRGNLRRSLLAGFIGRDEEPSLDEEMAEGEAINARIKSLLRYFSRMESELPSEQSIGEACRRYLSGIAITDTSPDDLKMLGLLPALKNYGSLRPPYQIIPPGKDREEAHDQREEDRTLPPLRFSTEEITTELGAFAEEIPASGAWDEYRDTFRKVLNLLAEMNRAFDPVTSLIAEYRQFQTELLSPKAGEGEDFGRKPILTLIQRILRAPKQPRRGVTAQTVRRLAEKVARTANLNELCAIKSYYGRGEHGSYALLERTREIKTNSSRWREQMEVASVTSPPSVSHDHKTELATRGEELLRKATELIESGLGDLYTAMHHFEVSHLYYVFGALVRMILEEGESCDQDGLVRRLSRYSPFEKKPEILLPFTAGRSGDAPPFQRPS
ncbi:hypothetical protein MRY87_12085, partial [bacterium]|nr:hypothetical protein [bacterium]